VFVAEEAREQAAEQFALAVRALALSMIQYRNAALRSVTKIGPSDGVTLGRLHADGPQTPTELAAKLSLTTGAMTTLLDRLQGAGYIARHPHPTDRRSVVVELTDTARRLIAEDLLTPLIEVLTPVFYRVDSQRRRDVIAAVTDAEVALRRAASQLVDATRGIAAGDR
jgi:DNA-binding MarR family transcriptional regulator